MREERTTTNIRAMRALGVSALAGLLTMCASVAIPMVWGARPPAAAALPPPPYSRFAGQTFEPSAAAFDPASRRILVLSDHDTTLYRYEVRDAALLLPPGDHHDPIQLPAGMRANKLEGLTRLPSGDFLAVTAFDRPDPSFRRLLRFSYAPERPLEALPMAVPDAALDAAIRTVSRQPWFKIEGLAVDRSGAKLLFGIRSIGQGYETPRDIVLIVRCPLGDDRVGPPEAVIQLSTVEALGRAEGLSDLQLDADGDSVLILTSHEGTSNTPESHSGHLFRVAVRALLGAAPSAPMSLGAPLRGFRAKPEGLAVEPSGALIVVFDDDRDWKHLFAGYEQSEGLFTRIDPRP